MEMTDSTPPGTVAGAIEERVLRCDVCDRPFVLAYRRGDAAGYLSSSRVTSEWVRCPISECHHVQPVIVPFEGGIVSVAEWFGSPGATPLGPTYREVLASGRRRTGPSTKTPRPRKWPEVEDGKAVARAGRSAQIGAALRQLRVVALLGLAFLALLSVIEFTFPRLKWLTFPAMVTGIAFLAAVHLLDRVRDWRASFRSLRSGDNSGPTEPANAASPAPIEPE
jgi:hypothetical protein